MKLICGLGNPGDKYKRNRHNVGFMVVDDYSLIEGFSLNLDIGYKAELFKQGSTIFVKPQNYMNNSGEVLSKVVGFYKIQPKDILVIHDDVDLEVGKIKLDFGAGSAGHNGVKDILLRLNDIGIWRLRIGIGRPQNPAYSIEDWVLSDLSDEEIEATVKNNTVKDKIKEFLKS